MKDLIVPTLLIGVVLAMMLPMPTWALDFLLVANIASAVGIVMSAVFVTDSLKLSTLPTLLLVGTLVRLGLNVSTTRMILSRGEAGEVIQAFGGVMVSGNVLVGAIVFLVISLIQLLVIAKGAERVAEVSARFTLDALPGKQMSIDADIRAGLIDSATAKIKREELQLESRFYGALDGAMKFIKGDAIAGLTIVCINVIGGLITGVALHDLSLVESVRKYTLLSVGDGLVTQIPALLSAIAAGLVVTRVSKGEQSLGRDLLGQLAPSSLIRFCIAGFCLGVACIPGVPWIPCAVLGVFSAASALCMNSSRNDAQLVKQSGRFIPVLATPLTIYLGKGVIEEELESTPESFALRLQEMIFKELGILLPAVQIKKETEADFSYKMLIRGVVVKEEGRSMEREETVHQIVRYLAKHPEDIVDDMTVRRMLDWFETISPDLVSSVVPGTLSVTQLTVVVRDLLSEGVPVTHFDLVLQAIVEGKSHSDNSQKLVEDVRVKLRRIIVDTFKGKEGGLSVYTLAPLDDLLLQSIGKEEGRKDLQQIEKLLSTIIETIREDSVPLIVSRPSRRVLHDLLKARGRDIPVLSFDEVLHEEGIEIIQTVSTKREVQGELHAVAA